ncbi:MAG: alpha/beta fold hydrolase [Candidatus Eremiobacteraeota bacterium]|nr:alpha/beta fold hydrolase [Candidatus Eremiobacteraeota bacterium]
MTREILKRTSIVALMLLFAGVFALPSSAHANSVRVVRDVAYAPPVAGGKHDLDIYAPRNAAGLPVVIFIHGGGFALGDRSDYAYLGRALANLGVVAVLPSYRLIPNTDANGTIADAAAAVKWTGTHIKTYGGDPTRVILVGHSVGGYLVAMLALDRKLLADTGITVRGTLALSGWDYDVRQVGLGLLAASSDEVPIFFGSGEPARAAVSPITYARKDAAPLVLVCGGDGDEYACFQRGLLVKALSRVGSNFTIVDDPSAAHLDTVSRLAERGSVEQSALLRLLDRP